MPAARGDGAHPAGVAAPHDFSSAPGLKPGAQENGTKSPPFGGLLRNLEARTKREHHDGAGMLEPWQRTGEGGGRGPRGGYIRVAGAHVAITGVLASVAVAVHAAVATPASLWIIVAAIE